MGSPGLCSSCPFNVVRMPKPNLCGITGEAEPDKPAKRWCPIKGCYSERAAYLLMDQVANNGHQWMFSGGAKVPDPLPCEKD